METLDPLISEFATLHKKKQDLLGAKAVIDKKLKELKLKVMELSDQTGNIHFPIEPKSEEEKNLWGEPGSLQVKVKNDYERITRDKLTVFCIRFYTLLFPTESKEEISLLGLGQADWIWTNRESTSTHYLERNYPVKNEVVSKKDPESKQITKRSRTVTKDMFSIQDIPRTKEEFENLTVFKKLKEKIQN
jgi:hypothetical protein